DDHSGLTGREDWGARFSREDIRSLMKEVFKSDRDAFLLVSGAQTVWANKLLDASATRMADGQGSKAFSAAAQEIGAGFGFIADAAGLARIKEGQELDEAQQRNLKLLMALANTGLAIPQSAGWPIVAGMAGAWTGVIEDSVKGNTAEKAVVD